MHASSQLFGAGSFHGGVWRCAYTIDTLGVYSAVAFYLKTYKSGIAFSLLGSGTWLAWLAGAV